MTLHLFAPGMAASYLRAKALTINAGQPGLRMPLERARTR